MLIEREGIMNNYCVNEKHFINVYLDYLKEFIKTYKKNGFFGMIHLNEYSHGSSETLNFIDEDLLSFLKEFYSEFSYNTILIMYSDHGPRFSQMRKSIKGLLDERNPFFSIYLPNLFKKKYPKEALNLRKNSFKLTSPMDIYNTLINFLNSELLRKKYKDKRSLNLFKKISSKRSCKRAGISRHWCACLKRTELVIDEKLTELAHKFVDYLNYVLLKPHLDKCQYLELNQISKVYLHESYINTNESEINNEKLKKFAQNMNLRLQEEPKIENDYKEYFFQLSVKPSNAIYELTIIVEQELINLKKLNVIKINPDQISRINKYGATSACIYDTVPSIRQYCFCLNQI